MMWEYMHGVGGGHMAGGFMFLAGVFHLWLLVFTILVTVKLCQIAKLLEKK